MPEYLAPGVYVEEVNSGSKPIEGVSTSTAGMVGVTEFGPEGVPVLVTSYGEYRRIFGGELRLSDFTDGNDRIHAYLPHAVQGFFQNDGRRNYVVRASVNDALRATRELFDRGAAASVETMLLRQAPQDSGTAVNVPLLYVLNVGSLAADDWIRVSDGSRAEYRRIVGAPVAGAIHTATAAPLAASYAIDPAIEVFGMAAAYIAALGTFTLAEAAERGAISIVIDEGAVGDAATLAGIANPVLEIGFDGVSEFIRATHVIASGTQATVILERALGADIFEETGGVPLPVRVIDAPAPVGSSSQLAIAASAGDLLVYPDDMTAVVAGDWLVIGDVTSTDFEVHQMASLGAITLDIAAYDDYPARSQIQLVDMSDYSGAITALTDAQVFEVDPIGELEVGMAVDINGESAVIQSTDGNEITLVAALLAAPAVGDLVIPVSELTAAANAGAVVLSLSNRVGLATGSVLRLGAGPEEEYVEVASIGGERGVAPDAGTVILSTALAQTHADGTALTYQAEPRADNSRQPAYSVLGAAAGENTLYISDEDSYVDTDIVRLTTPGGASYYHRLVADATAIGLATVEVHQALDFSHDSGSAMAQRAAEIEVHALDRGAWANRLQVAVSDPESSLVQAELTAANGLNPVITLSNFTNLEAGAVLEFQHPATGAQIGDLAKVISVDRDAGEVVLAAIPHADVVSAHTTLAENVTVRSREFELTVYLLQRPDPAVPSRNRTVIDSESFIVTMDPRNSHYIQKVIGTTWVAGAEQDDAGADLRLWDRRSEGASRFIRVRDLATTVAEQESIRLGPEPLIDVLDSGREQAARLPLSDGDDGLDSILGDAQGDAIYLGVDSDEPRLRSGIHALRNVQDISIVAVPGQTTVGVQQGLINHCENDRYRFAVLDAHGPNRDTVADVQVQRQAFDSKYAALYHPWLTIPEPLPENLSSIRQMPIPPSGHMMGVYARVDNNRGVHKAPANEVVQGIIGLTRSLNKREQDILNPFPRNINVVRDFRSANRGLRVWGARCITSDSDYKYVNVRRLMISLEASIDRGLQWVVFEPNAEPLWARVRRSITNFLNVVWRNGALEGTTPDQAFFVRCDRTTMTQTDIDNGRLICQIGVAPVKPAEFVIVRIGLWTASAD